VRRNEIAEWLKGLQDRICASLETLEPSEKFQQDQWERPGGGGGRTRIIQGQVIEKGGVNFSAVHGELSPVIARSLGLAGENFFATGVSIVLHPKNPLVPIIHMNVRYFESGDTWWFGGGIDLTPHYIVPEDATFFHSQLKNTCDRFDPNFYPEHKAWADDYFFIKHRQETRGIGGIFYDKLGDEVGFDKAWAYTQGVGDTFAPTYVEIASRHKDKAYTEAEVEWQKLRRGRYVEFNLVYDRGTKFGLETDGRIESILMSLPKDASWYYNHQPQEGTREHETLSLLKKGIHWV